MQSFLNSRYLVKSLNVEQSNEGPGTPYQGYRESCVGSAPFSEFLDLAVIQSICDLSWEAAAFLQRALNVDIRDRRAGSR